VRHRLERSTLIPKPKREIFAFFADAHNLERITPAFLRFRILTPDPIVICAGTVIDYQIRLHGVPIHWRTLIQEFSPGSTFTDVQVEGPYRYWHHRHEFEDVPGGTRMRDQVDYELGFGVLGELAWRLFVRSHLERIFDHRNRSIAAFL
jgi:ligand-binding SRPBCC domain-containing protein